MTTSDKHAFQPAFSSNCAILERTGDGKVAGRCYFHSPGDKCPRHGDVSGVMENYRRTGQLTDEKDFKRT